MNPGFVSVACATADLQQTSRARLNIWVRLEKRTLNNFKFQFQPHYMRTKTKIKEVRSLSVTILFLSNRLAKNITKQNPSPIMQKTSEN
jgi:hypothetical protein